jgi:hypothetical protein
MAIGVPRVTPSSRPLDDDTDAAAVGFPEGADAKEVAEAAAHGLYALGRAYKPATA